MEKQQQQQQQLTYQPLAGDEADEDTVILIDDESDDADFFQRASQADRIEKIRAVFALVSCILFFYFYILPNIPGIPIELTPNGLRTPSSIGDLRVHHHDGPGLHNHRPCAHRKSREHVHGYLSNARIASTPQATFSSYADLLDPKAVEKYFEKIFLAVPSAEEAKKNLWNLTSTTHVAGTKSDYTTAINVLQQWGSLLGVKLPDDTSEMVHDAGSPESIHLMTSTRESSGLHSKHAPRTHPLGEPQLWIDTYSVWLNYPVSSSLTLSKANETNRPYFRASLAEDVLPKDPTSADGLPPFHGYSKSGKAAGQIVYAALCTRKDFDRLEELDISVKGKITLCRYGGPFRGLKVRESAARGAIGTLIYTDPNEDSITAKDGVLAYPDGPARAPSSVQRGSVQAISIYPGDAATPGKPSYRNASRIDPDTADSLPAIPSLPISYKDAFPLLQSLYGKGKKASDVGPGWQGAIPGVEEYWTGPSGDIAQMDNQMTDYSEPKDIWNTYAKIPGVIEDEVVVIGNHRDAWTFGAGDPSSGTATLHEVVSGLGALIKTGWRPLRTILIAGWDAEEYGLIGSTEAAEDYPEFFKEKAVILLNVDVAISGSKAAASSSPSLIDLLVNAASEIHDPSGNGTKIALKTPGALGSGSDFTAFLQNLGIASADLRFQEAQGDPVYHYHSNYDSFHWMEKFGDPNFARHHAVAQWLGLVLLRSAQGIFVPLNIGRYADALQGYMEKVKSVAPEDLDLSRLEKSIGSVNKRARAFEATRAKLEDDIRDALSGHRKHSNPWRSRPELGKLFAQVRKINKQAKSFESNFLSKDGKGLTQRPFYQHLGVAPGRYLGYGATTFPGLTESITLDAGNGTQHEIARLVEALDSVAEDLRQA